MGKQTAVAMTEVDELAFLQFLRDSADVRLLPSAAPSEPAMWIDTFGPHENGHRQFFIWNTAFAWTPEFEQTSSAVPAAQRGWYHILNRGTAPLVEYDRHDFANPRSLGGTGRIYWSKYFAAPEGLWYDVELFDAWYQRIVRWIRKHGKRGEGRGERPFYLPDAWETYGALRPN
jgi:hypothetical protein